MWFREWKTLLPVVVGGVMLGMSVALDWVVALKRQSANHTLQKFWRSYGGYPPLKQTSSGDLHWFGTRITSTEEFLHISIPFLAFGLMACGLTVVVLRRRHFQGLLLALPLVAAAGMAATDHYPLARRLALYLCPIVVMLLAAPLAFSDGQRNPTARWWRSTAVVASAAVLIAVTGPGMALGLDKAVHPDETASLRQDIAFVAQHQHAGDLVLAQTGAPSVLAMAFYGPGYHVREGGLFYLGRSRDGTCADPFSKLHRVTRVWLVFAELTSGQPSNRDQIFLSHMPANGRLVLSYAGIGGAGAYLFDLSRSRANEPLPVHPSGRLECFSIRAPWDGRAGH